MRLSTIWTIQSMSTIERLRRTREWAAMEVAHRLPKQIKYWTVMETLVKATPNAPEDTTVGDVLNSLKHL